MAKSPHVITMPFKLRGLLNRLEREADRVQKHCLIDPVTGSRGVNDTADQLEFAGEKLKFFADVLRGMHNE